jgi:hypothetical protein
MIRFPCPGCKKEIAVDNNFAAMSGKCSWCGADMTVPEAFAPGTKTDFDRDANQAPARRPDGAQDDPNNPYARYPEPYQQPAQGGGSNAAMGWLIFILIFGVGNVILYATTGWFLIPIRR